MTPRPAVSAREILAREAARPALTPREVFTRNTENVAEVRRALHALCDELERISDLPPELVGPELATVAQRVRRLL